MSTPTKHSPEQPIVIINTPAELEAARSEVERLVDAEAGSVDALTFQAFSAAIELYLSRQNVDPRQRAGSQLTSGTAADFAGSSPNSR